MRKQGRVIKDNLEKRNPLHKSLFSQERKINVCGPLLIHRAFNKPTRFFLIERHTGSRADWRLRARQKFISANARRASPHRASRLLLGWHSSLAHPPEQGPSSTSNKKFKAPLRWAPARPGQDKRGADEKWSPYCTLKTAVRVFESQQYKKAKQKIKSALLDHTTKKGSWPGDLNWVQYIENTSLTYIMAIKRTYWKQDYEGEDVFRCPQATWQFQPHFPAVKQGLIQEQDAERALIWMSSMSESHWWSLFHKEVKS